MKISRRNLLKGVAAAPVVALVAKLPSPPEPLDAGLFANTLIDTQEKADTWAAGQVWQSRDNGVTWEKA